MKKILVTTDLSTNSRAALRFAIQLASQNGYQLTFLHIAQILRPTTWSDKVFHSFEQKAYDQAVTALQKLVATPLRNTLKINQQANCVVLKGVSPIREIIQYAEDNGFNYICASRNGMGNTIKPFGDTVSALISKCSIPIIAVPEMYKKSTIDHLTYVSDLISVENELKTVLDFAESLKAKVELLHFKVPIDILLSPEELENITNKLKKHQVTTHFDVLNYQDTFIKNMDKVLKKTRPSLVVMFTKPRKGLFEKLFLSSISAEYAQLSRVPLLIFRKNAS